MSAMTREQITLDAVEWAAFARRTQRKWVNLIIQDAREGYTDANKAVEARNLRKATMYAYMMACEEAPNTCREFCFLTEEGEKVIKRWLSLFKQAKW